VFDAGEHGVCACKSGGCAIAVVVRGQLLRILLHLLGLVNEAQRRRVPGVDASLLQSNLITEPAPQILRGPGDKIFAEL
jgi:hypothetical protein